MATNTHHTLDVDGLTVAYVDEGEGSTVLLLHGWPTSSYLYRNITPVLAERHRVVVPDLPGFGGSSKPVDLRYSFEFFHSILDTVVERLGLTDIGLVVHDLGGPVGVHWALHRPGLVSRLALLNTLLYPEFDPSTIEFVAQLLDPARRDELTSDDGLQEALRVGVARPDALAPETLAAMSAPFRTDDDRLALAAAAIGLHPSGFVDIARLLPDLHIPVLGLYGAEDRILPDVADTFARVHADVPHAEIVAIPDAGHFLQEDAPAEVADRLARFFDGRSSGG
jgi:pimeloyl-ACP methyl ester carboxylesterase